MNPETYGAFELVPVINALTGLFIAFPGVVAAVISLLSLRQSRRNGLVAAQVLVQGRDNADAIDHTRVQNVRLASAVQDTKVQNDELATAVGHVHICVETKMAEVREAVEKVPETVKEIVPDVIKETLPEAIKKL